MEEIAKKNNIDLTGTEQHGFKKNRSTATAGLTLQSKIARVVDLNGYLSAAFDLANLKKLLHFFAIFQNSKYFLTWTFDVLNWLICEMPFIVFVLLGLFFSNQTNRKN